MDQTFNVTRDDLDLRSQVTHELYARNGHKMQIIKRLTVLYVNVTQKIILGLQEGIIRVLASKKFLLLEQALDLVNRELALHVT